ncbi:hypothetical protein A0H81_07180 [Grifola frondosa]|uniref:Uncharacterized protein n=1 Tax=Grifola frondosa TaxID=5627 RepID=A0A1C7M7P4_GRIFR|nr:hypothetical protein A0H81_07180 [Grifola frondosa]
MSHVITPCRSTSLPTLLTANNLWCKLEIHHGECAILPFVQNDIQEHYVDLGILTASRLGRPAWATPTLAMIPSMRSPSPRPSISALPDELIELTLVSPPLAVSRPPSPPSRKHAAHFARWCTTRLTSIFGAPSS